MPCDLTECAALTEYLTRNGNIMGWRDQVALVTGGARGIGRATARLLAQLGAAVCMNYAAHADAADGLAAEIVAGGRRAGHFGDGRCRGALCGRGDGRPY